MEVMNRQIELVEAGPDVTISLIVPQGAFGEEMDEDASPLVMAAVQNQVPNESSWSQHRVASTWRGEVLSALPPGLSPIRVARLLQTRLGHIVCAVDWQRNDAVLAQGTPGVGEGGTSPSVSNSVNSGGNVERHVIHVDPFIAVEEYHQLLLDYLDARVEVYQKMLRNRHEE